MSCSVETSASIEFFKPLLVHGGCKYIFGIRYDGNGETFTCDGESDKDRCSCYEMLF